MSRDEGKFLRLLSARDGAGLDTLVHLCENRGSGVVGRYELET